MQLNHAFRAFPAHIGQDPWVLSSPQYVSARGLCQPLGHNYAVGRSRRGQPVGQRGARVVVVVLPDHGHQGVSHGSTSPSRV